MDKEYLNIIDEDIIYEVNHLPTTIICVIGMVCLLSVLIMLFVKNNPDFATKLLSIIVCVLLPLILISGILSAIFLRVPIGTKYSATIDKSKITVEEYEEFIEKYNPEIKDGIYYWRVEKSG